MLLLDGDGSAAISLPVCLGLQSTGFCLLQLTSTSSLTGVRAGGDQDVGLAADKVAEPILTTTIMSVLLIVASLLIHRAACSLQLAAGPRTYLVYLIRISVGFPRRHHFSFLAYSVLVRQTHLARLLDGREL